MRTDMIDPPERLISNEARNDAHTASTGVRRIGAHPGLPHQKTNRKLVMQQKVS